MPQIAVMLYDPATGNSKPYPSSAKQWREWHGKTTVWLFDPWTGTRRSSADVSKDPTGILISQPKTFKVQLESPRATNGSNDLGSYLLNYPRIAELKNVVIEITTKQKGNLQQMVVAVQHN